MVHEVHHDLLLVVTTARACCFLVISTCIGQRVSWSFCISAGHADCDTSHEQRSCYFCRLVGWISRPMHAFEC